MSRRTKRRKEFTEAQRAQLVSQITETHRILMLVAATLDPRCEAYEAVARLSDALLASAIQMGGHEADWSAVRPGRMPTAAGQ